MSGTAPGVPLTVILTTGVGVDVSAARGLRGVSVALHARRRVFALHVRLHESELSARDSGRGRVGTGDVPDDLSRLLFRPLAAHPLRGLPERRRVEQRGEQGRHLADRAAAGAERRGLRDGRLRGQREEPGATSRWRRTTCSATAIRWSSRRCPATSPTGYTAMLTVAI